MFSFLNNIAVSFISKKNRFAKLIEYFFLLMPSLLAISGNMFIVIICCPACNDITFEIKLSLLIKPFFLHIQKSGKNCKCMKNKESHEHEIKSFFHIFKKTFSCQNLSQAQKQVFKNVM